MADLKIVEAVGWRQRRDFCRFPIDLYAGCPQFVPSLILEEMDALNPKRSPAFDTAEVKLFLAMNTEGRCLGRIAAIDSHGANEKFGAKDIRFSWFDCVEDYGVAQALFDTASDWGRSRSLETISGPHGFSFFDKEGMLVEGFDWMPTFVTAYNYPYYNDFVLRYGFEKKYDFIEFRIDEPVHQVPEKLARIARKLEKRGGFRVAGFSSKRKLRRRIPEMFNLIEETYEELDDAVPLTTKQKAYYANRVFMVMHKDLAKIVETPSGEMIGFIFGVPSLSRALRKSNGRILPFGWFHLLRGLRGADDTVDMGLAGIKKAYRGRGVDVALVEALTSSAAKLGFIYAESNPELESNTRIQAEWKPFNAIQHKRRRIYKKNL